jgi:hypothetical protein
MKHIDARFTLGHIVHDTAVNDVIDKLITPNQIWRYILPPTFIFLSRYLMADTDKKTDKGRVYHTKCTGSALETVNKHDKDQDITLFGSCFCPFVQRAWVAFEFLGIPYKVC